MTGAGGFVGGYLVAALAERMPQASLVRAGLDGAEVALDLTDTAAVEAAVARHSPDVVVHLAAQASVGALGGDADATTWRVNLGGTLTLALAVARHAPDALVLFASSSEVYGRAFGAEPVDEQTPPQPGNAYARSKLAAERVLADVLPDTARLIVARPFNHTGAGQREAFVLPSWAGQVARIEKGLQAPAVRVGAIDVARDFLDVRDVAAAYCALIAAAPDLPPRFTCNIASGTARPLRDLLAVLQRASRVPFSVEVDPARLRRSDVPVARGDASLLRKLTGWTPSIPIEDTLLALLDHARGRVG